VNKRGIVLRRQCLTVDMASLRRHGDAEDLANIRWDVNFRRCPFESVSLKKIRQQVSVFFQMMEMNRSIIPFR
jgi:hypothetical protein